MRRFFSNRHFWVLLVVAVSIWLVSAPYRTSDFPYTHDGENHLARFANYYLAVKEGQYPPRFAPNLVNRYGYPVFNYNYPLGNILAVVPAAIGLEFEQIFKLQVVAALVIGALGIYVWLRLTTQERVPLLLAILGYLSLPLLLSTLHFRGNIGEIWAWALMPWAFWVAESDHDRLSLVKLAIGVSVLLAHNIMAFFGGVVLAGLAGIRWITTPADSARRWLLLTGILAVGCSLWFWLPALVEKDEVLLDQVAQNQVAALHTLTPTQLVHTPVRFGFSYPGPIDTLPLHQGLAILGTLLMAALWLPREKKLRTTTYLFVALGLLVIQTQPFSKLWELPVLSYIQFPWRLQWLVGLLAMGLLPQVYAQSVRARTLLVLLVLIQVWQIAAWTPVDFFNRDDIDYLAFTQTTTTQDEARPKTFTYSDVATWQPTPQALEGSAVFDVEYWSGSRRQYTATVESTAMIVEPTQYFLGWQTHVVAADESDAPARLVSYELSGAGAGRIAHRLEPGEYVVQSRFTQDTPARRVGFFSFFFSLAVIGYLYTKGKVRLI